jgi:hypothetical protein
VSDTPTIASARAGAVDCVCPPGGQLAGVAAEGAARGLGWLTVGAAASVLSQTLMYGLLPLAGGLYAPEPALVPVPFVALLVGAVAATFPASILRDAFGRRAAFALGASLGIGGGLVLAFGLTAASFWPIVLGAFWIGIANGFALQYRHAAVIGAAAGDAARSLSIVIGASAFVGIVAPLSASFFEAGLAPILGAGTALLAAAAHVVALAAALALPTGEAEPAAADTRPVSTSGWLLPTAIAAAAWFGMTAMMVDAPLGLAACGIGLSGTVGVIAWHVVAMYAPAGAIGVLARRLGSLPTAAAGLLLMAGAAASVISAAGAATIAAALIVNGIGWSLATSAAVVALHAKAPSRIAIAGHDATILAAAVAGAMLSQSVF